MKFKKIAAGAIAAALAVGTMAVSASAKIYPVPEDQRVPSLYTDGSWMILLYNAQDLPADSNKPATDRGLDLQAINSFTFYVELLPYPGALGVPLELYDGTIDGFGGNVIYSASRGGIGLATESDWYDEENGVTLFNKYNWPNNNTWWGFPAKDDTPEGRPVDAGGEGTNQGNVDYVEQLLTMEYVNEFAYKLEMDINRDHADDPDYRWPADGELYQVGLQAWGDGGNGESFGLKVDLMILKDADGNFIVGFDEYGNEITEDAVNEKIEWLESREINIYAGPDEDPYDMSAVSAPSDDPSGDTSDDSSGSDNASNNNGSDDGDSAGTTTTAAPTSGESSSNNSAPIIPIIIGVVVAVVVIVVIIIVVVTKKKKS